MKSSLLSQGIRVAVQSVYLPEHSNQRDSAFGFGYKIFIRNETESTVQLISRHWHITDGQGQRRVVNGPGVVGKQPLIEPRETFVYTSGCGFNTPIGAMEGFYRFIRLSDGEMFDARIPRFIMSWPEMWN